MVEPSEPSGEPTFVMMLDEGGRFTSRSVPLAEIRPSLARTMISLIRFVIAAHFIRLLSIVAVGAAAACTRATPVRSAPSGDRTRLFEFHSDFWVNLHHFLYVTARARAGLDATRTAVTSALSDTAGFGTLSRAQQDAWNRALVYYGRAVASRDILFDSSLVDVNDRLAEVETATTVGGAANLDPEIAAALDRAAPVYRALWWPRHDASNRRWTARAVAVLAEHGDAAARAEAAVFHHPWPWTPVRVDVSAYANWAGAYTTENPSHVNVRSTDTPPNDGATIFETLFHEVLHTMDDSLFAVLRTSFRASGKRWPRDPTHLFIFYTAGEVTRRLFPGHVPFAEQVGMWTRNPDFARMLPLLRAHWQPRLDGRGSLEEAMRRIADGW